MENQKSMMEKDYRLLRNAIIYSLLPKPIKLIYHFIIISTFIFFLRLYLSNSCPRTPNILPQDICSSYVNIGGKLICHHSDIQPLYNFFGGLWQLFKHIILYAYFGICF